MSSTPVEYNLEIIKDRTFSLNVYIRDSNQDAILITGWSGQAQIRKSQSPESELLATFTVSVADAALGKMNILLSKEDSVVCSDSGYWDLIITNADGHSVSYLKGTVTFSVLPTQSA